MPALKPRRRRPDRCGRVVAPGVLLAATLAGGCSLFGPEPVEVYVLTAVDGRALPTPHREEVHPDGWSWQIIMHGAELKLYSDGRFARTMLRQHRWIVLPGPNFKPPPEPIVVTRVTGTYQRTDSTLSIRFSDPHSLWATVEWEYSMVSIAGRTSFQGYEKFVRSIPYLTYTKQ